MATKRIAVIGAGAKAAAIAAKAACLNAVGVGALDLTLFDRGQAAENWRGSSGYTDGEQGLCTPTERDLGFPYETVFGPLVTERMQADYSWMAYAVRKSGLSYSDWVARGGRRPTHAQFADYLRYAIDRSQAQTEYGWTVTQLVQVGDQWRLLAQPTAGGAGKAFGLFDGVVITGPGPASSVFGRKTDSALFNGEDVWRRLPALRQHLRVSDEPVVIVGAGGAGAAIAAWMIRDGHANREINILASQASFYTRTNSYFENRVFDDDQIWELLGAKEKKAFVDRLTRGVVWEAVAEDLAKARGLNMVPGRAIDFTRRPRGSGGTSTPVVHFRPAHAPNTIADMEAAAIIDASGFDPWWFASLLPGISLPNLKRAAARPDFSLRLRLGGLPGLHVPGVCQSAGPGYTSLMVLGRLADRILRAYVP